MAEPTGAYLGPEDLALMREMVAWFKSLPRKGSARDFADDTHQAPEVYIAYLPDGIEGASGARPGHARANIYRIANGRLLDTGSQKDVYNLTDALPEGYKSVVRDKFGNWIVQSGGGIELSHGVILEPCNERCSTYRVQRVHRFLQPECEECDETGTGTGTGSGS